MPHNNAKLRKKLALYRARLKAEAALINDVSHEMRTPLAIAREALSLALGQKAQPVNKQKMLLSRASAGVARANRIVDELLEVARLESGRLKLKYSLVGLNEFLHSLVGSFRGLAREKNIRLSCRLPGMSVNIFIDADRVTEVLTNLIDNALKFTPSGGRIEVSASVFESKVRVLVNDTGVGIEKKHLGRIFTRFEQASAPGRHGKGLGLGLSIAKELIERHGGEIWAESFPGKGSQFYFTLPRFYSTQMLDAETRGRINELLDNDVTLHLINLLIVNFQGFMRIAGEPLGRRVTAGLNTVIEKSLDDFNRLTHSRDVFVSEFSHGECTIVIPKAHEKAVSKLCGLFRERINAYLRGFKIKDCFINVGVLEFLYRDSRQTSRGTPAAIYVKKIFIGAEKRRCRRISYHMKIEPQLFNRSLGQTYSLDISRHGICFLSSTPIATNARLILNLVLPRRLKPLSITGRVAWIKQDQEAAGTAQGRYKIGVEFVGLSGDKRRELNRFVDSLGRVRPFERA